MEPRKTRISQKRLLYWLAPVALALGLVLLILGNVAHFPWNPNNPLSNTGFWVLTSGWILVVLGGIGAILAWILYNVQQWPW